jgi:3-deoxy-D-manno-octulosonic-acid transferase
LSGLSILTVLVPRHPHRGDAIAAQLSAAKLTFARRSKAQVIVPETDMYLADTLGELGIFYRLAGVVFIGGSLVPRGGHNPIEGAQLDCAMVCGMHMHNFTNIVEDLKEAGAIKQLVAPELLGEALLELLRDQELQEAMAQRAHARVDAGRGASDIIAQHVLTSLGIAPPSEEETQPEQEA